MKHKASDLQFWSQRELIELIEKLEANKIDIHKELEYTNEILEIIDNRDEFTRSDLQGIVQAIIKKIQEAR